ncbi:hypothetical protein B7494_g249 [Chlorociboria aeruginascens]|nr:hypothetical protein B7494_g249 [Chlorociboria aeruginascens]
MFKFPSAKMAGPGYIILNILRAMNIISLLLVAVASWVMIVTTIKTSNFFFFDGVSHFITSSIALFLIVSELDLFKTYFYRRWPMLSPESGLVFLGLSMLSIGCVVLGNLNKSATSIENLGLPLWRVVISSGILACIMGFANIIGTFVFCDNKQGITGRQVRSHGAAIPKEPSGKSFSLSSGSVHRPASPVLPSYHTTSEDRRRSRFGLKFPIRLSGISKATTTNQTHFPKWDSRSSPVAPEVQRPPTALHPAYHPTEAPYPADVSSRYSVASQVSRF